VKAARQVFFWLKSYYDADIDDANQHRAAYSLFGTPLLFMKWFGLPRNETQCADAMTGRPETGRSNNALDIDAFSFLHAEIKLTCATLRTQSELYFNGS
jgi:hypothetical protein